MMGWVMLLILMLASAVALALLHVPRRLWSLVGAALMLGAAGYAWQGAPTLPGHPVKADREALVSDAAIIDLRTDMFGRYGAEGAYLTAADAMARVGSSRYEVETILGALRGAPKSVQLWTALGDALVRHDGGRVSPAARLAFDQANRLDPRHPGPYFFLGVALVRSGDLAGAERCWTRALERTHPQANYRPAIAERLAMVRQLIAATDGR